MNNRVFDYFDELFPNPRCELNYNKDYELLIAVMLSAQTTDKRVNSVTSVLFKKYPTLHDLGSADVSDIIDIIRSIGTFNKKANNVILIAQALEASGGVIINDREFLMTLPGVGRKTVNVVLNELFHEPCIAVDTHVARVSKRLGIAKDKDDVLIIEKKLYKAIPLEKQIKIHHQLLLFGRYHCKAINPNCNNCKIKDLCKRRDITK